MIEMAILGRSAIHNKNPSLQCGTKENNHVASPLTPFLSVIPRRTPGLYIWTNCLDDSCLGKQ